MTHCGGYEKLISRYIDRDLDATQRRSVEAHLFSCRSCKQTLGEFTALKRLLVEDAAAGARETAVVPECAPDETAPWPTGWIVPWRLAAMVAIAFSLLTGLYFHSSMHRALPLPTIIENQSRAVFNTPLGALVYYEELAGTTVHAQYGGIRETAYSLNGESIANGTAVSPSGYESPLFCDTTTVKARYRSITSSPVF